MSNPVIGSPLTSNRAFCAQAGAGEDAIAATIAAAATSCKAKGHWRVLDIRLLIECRLLDLGLWLLDRPLRPPSCAVCLGLVVPEAGCGDALAEHSAAERAQAQL